MGLDWGRLEEVVERAVRRARSEELREMADAVKALAEYMKTGFRRLPDNSPNKARGWRRTRS
ncbi:MAG: hypothetical protein ACP5HD_03155 [Thermoproteus sp.]